MGKRIGKGRTWGVGERAVPGVADCEQGPRRDFDF